MPRQVDLVPQNFKVSHDPNDQLSTDVGVKKAVTNLSNVLLQLPKMIQDVIKTILGTALNPIPELQEWADNLRGDIEKFFDALDGISLDGDPGAVLGAIFAPLNELSNKLLGGSGRTFPHLLDYLDTLEGNPGGGGNTFPTPILFTFGAEQPRSPFALMVTNLRSFLTPNLTVTGFDLDDALDAFITDRLKPRGLLAELLDGKLVDDQAPAVVQGIIDRIKASYNDLGELTDFDNPLSSVLDSTFGIFNTALGAQVAAGKLAARIAALESAANTIVLDFTGASASNPGSDWDVTLTGGGGGSMGLDGKGNLVWKTLGAGSRIAVGRYTGSALTTNNGLIQTVLSSSPQNPIFDDAFTYINFRMNTTKTTYTRVRVGYGTVRMQAVVSGVITNIGAEASVSPTAGDLLEIAFGEPAGANPLHFVVTLGVPILDFTDGGTAQYGGSYLHIGAGMETGNRLVFFQNIPPGLGVLTAMEVV